MTSESKRQGKRQVLEWPRITWYAMDGFKGLSIGGTTMKGGLRYELWVFLGKLPPELTKINLRHAAMKAIRGVLRRDLDEFKVFALPADTQVS